MNIQAFPSGPFQTNAYVVACTQTKEAAIVDPAPGSFAKIQAYISNNQLVPTKVLLTHSHWDHIADAFSFKKAYDVPVYVHPLDSPNLENPGADSLPCWIDIKGTQPDGFLNEGDIIRIGNLNFVVIHTPGHTPGGVCFYSKENDCLLAGDTLFRGTIGNLSFPTCQPDLMWLSLDKLAKLPLETVVYPGHGPSTTIGRESWLPEAKKHFGY